MTASILPPAKTTFFDANGDPLALGRVYFYIPTTFTPKNTWQDASQSILNTNPVDLDASGSALIYGSGIYRQIVKDSLGNTIWDQLTNSFSLDAIADDRFLANISGGSAVPTATTLTAFIDSAIGNAQGSILYRNSTIWTVLAPGTNGQILQTQGAGANPHWTTGATTLSALVRQSTGQSVTDATATPLSFDTKVYDDASIWASGAPTRLTVPTNTSRVVVHGNVRFYPVAAATGILQLWIYKNGAKFFGMPFSAVNGSAATRNWTTGVSSGVLAVSPGDYFQLYVLQASGGSLVTSDAADPSGFGPLPEAVWFSMEIVE